MLFRFRPEATDELRRSFEQAVLRLPEEIPAIAACTAGPDLGLPGDCHDFALMLDFADATAFAAYKDAPAHRRLIAEHITPLVAETARAQVVL